jgi:DNA (cytosine-5)-methyltransferase 1
VITVEFTKVVGKCHLLYCDILESPTDWCDQGPYRFYFSETYDVKTYKFGEVPDYAKKVGYAGKGKGKGKSKSTKIHRESEIAPLWDKIEQPLRCMDVFAGCGGLSKGLHQAGIAETKWAVRKISRSV